MVVNWNIKMLNNLLAQKQLRLLNQNAEYNINLSDMNVLTAMLSHVEPLKCEYSNVSSDINNLFNSKKYYNINQLNSMNIKEIFNQNATCKVRDIILYKPMKITYEDGIKLLNYSLSKNDINQSKKFIYYLNHNYIHFDNNENINNKAFTGNLLNDSIQLIYLNNKNDLHSYCELAHEFGHAYQYSNNHTYEGNINISASMLSEVYAILHQLLFIDNIKCCVKKKETLKLKYDSIIRYQNWCKNLSNPKYMKYAYSGLLAFYFFNLYKTDYQNFNNKINLFNKLIFQDSDIEIIKQLNITLNELYNGFNNYVECYELDKKRK